MKKALDRLEVFTKFADRISYNFFCFSGWVTPLIYFLIESEIFSHVPLLDYLDSTNFGGKCANIIAFQFLWLFIYAFLFALEQFFKFRITNKSFLSDKDIARFRACGVGLFVIFLLVPLFGLLVVILLEFF